ncbi:phage tail tape measure protein [uncultured Roseibium sp.]|uniref:phage tail tape measure protein n=1 Tax=uncultured Roseibium sp. TaxID=1936171 RepID=UPI0032171F36
MMSTLTSSLVVRLIDQVTKPARAMTSSLLGLQKAGGAGFGARLNDAIERNNQALDRSRGRLFDAVAGFYALRSAITAPVRAAAEFESALSDVTKVIDFGSKQAFEDFKTNLDALSKSVPITANGLAQIAAAAGQAGIAGDELVKFTEAAAKIGVAFDLSADETGTALAKMMTGLGLTLDQVILLSDGMNHLSNSQASSAKEILDVVRRVGAQAKLYGFTAEQTAAFASAMIAAGAKSDETATSFRNMGMALTKGAAATGRQKAAFKELGLSAKQVAKDMQRDAVGTTIEVLEKLARVPKEAQAAISSDLFGNEARALGPLLTNLDLLKKSIGLVSDESKYAGSSFAEFEVRAGTFENAIAIFNNRLSSLSRSIGEALIPAIADLMNAITPAIDMLASFAAAHPDITRNVTAAVAAIIGFKIATAGLTFVGLLGRGSALSMLSLGFNTVGRAAIGAARGASGMVGLQKTLAAMAGANYGGLRMAVDALKGMALAIPGVGALTSALTAVGAALAGITAPVWAGIAAAVAAVAAAGYALWKYWDRISSVLGGVAQRIGEELKPAFDAMKPVLDLFAPAVDAIGKSFDMAGKAIGDFMGWIGSFFEKEALTEEQKAAWGKAGYDMADRMIQSIKDAISDLVDWFASLPGKILDAVGSIDLGSLISMPSLGGLLGGGDSEPAPRMSAEDRRAARSGHRATGGPVWGGGDYLVGDAGEPEVFKPKQTGEVTPLSAIENKIDSGFSRLASSIPQAQQGGQTINVGDIIVQAAQSPVETARLVREVLTEEINSALRGANADVEARA